MNDPTIPDPPDVQAVALVGAVTEDLVKLSEALPVHGEDTEDAALRLEGLSCKLAIAAMLVRTTDPKPAIIRPCSPGGISS